MAREVSLDDAEYAQLEKDLNGNKLTGAAKIIGQTVYDQAKAARTSANMSEVGWYFRWTYYF